MDILLNFDMNTHRTGYIHSHHALSIGTAFSGTDLKELEEMAFNHFDQFLSVIVNVFGKHNAKLAIKAEVISIVEWSLGNHKEREEVKTVRLKTFDLKVKQRKSTDPLWTLFDSQLKVLKEEIAQKAALVTAQANMQINKAHNAMNWGNFDYKTVNPSRFIPEPEELENTFCDNAFTFFDTIADENLLEIVRILFKEFIVDNPIPKGQKVAYVKELLSYLKEYYNEYSQEDVNYDLIKRNLDFVRTLITNLQ